MSEINVSEITKAIETTVDELLAEMPSELSPYEIAIIANAVLTVAVPEDVEYKAIRSQYMYNYSKNGMIVKGSKRTGAGVKYTVAEVNAFLKKYLVRRVVQGDLQKGIVSSKINEILASKIQTEEVLEGQES